VASGEGALQGRVEGLDDVRDSVTLFAIFEPQPWIEYGISWVADWALGYGWAGDGAR
jgi:hypothetical protein